MNFKIAKHTFIFSLISASALFAQGKDTPSNDAQSIKVPSSDKSTERMQEKLRQQKAKADKRNSFFGAFSGATPQLEADEPIVFDQESETMFAKGNVKIADKLFEVDSDEIEYSPKAGSAKVKGDVRISLEQLRLVANEASLDVSQDKINSSLIRFGSYPLFVQLEDLDADKSLLKANNARIYYNEPAFASLNIKADSFSYETETKMLEVQGATLQIGDVPIMYFPDLSIEDPRIPPIKLELDYGYSSDLGLFGRNTVLYNAFDSISPGALLDFYTSRGILFGPAADFNYKGADTQIWGTLRTGYIHDNGLDGDLAYDTQGDSINKDRGFIDLDYKQRIGDNFEITAVLNYWSDSEVLRDFRPDMFDDDQIPDNFIELNYFGDDYIAAAFARFELNDWEDVQERLPEISITALPTNFFGIKELNQTAYASYVSLREYNDGISGDITSNRFDAYYGLDMPIALNSWSTLTPVVGVRASYYLDTTDNSDYTKVLGQVGFDFNMNAWGTWEIESDSLDLNGLRHNLRPIVMYRYIPAASQGSSSIYTIDDDVFSTSPEMLDLGLSRDIDDLDDINTLRLGLENSFYTRAKGYGSRKIASLNFYQDINFTEQKVYKNADEYEYSNYSNFFAGLDVYPAEWLSFGLYSRTDLDTGDVNQADFYVRLYDSDSAGIEFTTNYMNDQISQYWLRVNYKITQKYRLWARWRFDAELSELTEQIYSLTTLIGNTWLVEYRISVASGSTRDNGVTFSVGLRLMGF